MNPSGRCPRCGYVLKSNGYTYRCEFCRYPNQPQARADAIHEKFTGFQKKFANIFKTYDKPPPKPVRHHPLRRLPHPHNQHKCIRCGLRLSPTTPSCPRCGAAHLLTQPTYTPASTNKRNPQLQAQEKVVFDYILTHNGTISISQAAEDLAITPDTLRSTIERLKAGGLIEAK